MTRLRKFARLPPGGRTLLIRTVFVVAVIRLALWVLPFRYLRRLLETHFRGPSGAAWRPMESVAQLVWAVRAAASSVPCASCLTQAMALHCLLIHAGYVSAVHIGIAREPRSRIRAHAWVEQAGRPLLTTPVVAAQYTKIASWPRPPA